MEIAVLLLGGNLLSLINKYLLNKLVTFLMKCESHLIELHPRSMGHSIYFQSMASTKFSRKSINSLGEDRYLSQQSKVGKDLKHVLTFTF